MNFYSSDPAIQEAYEKKLLFQKAKDAVIEIVCDGEFWFEEAYQLIDSLDAEVKKFNEIRMNLEAYQLDHELLNWYQNSPNDFMRTINPATLVRVKALLARS